MDLNKVMIIGRLTRDPEVRTISSGQNVASFSVATSRQWKDQQGQPQSITEFHIIVAWRKLADIAAQYLKKGKQIYIEGYLQTRSWEDQSGQKRHRTEVVVENFIMLGSKDQTAQPAVQPTPPSAQPASYTSPAPAPAHMVITQPAQTDDDIRVEDITF